MTGVGTEVGDPRAPKTLHHRELAKPNPTTHGEQIQQSPARHDHIEHRARQPGRRERTRAETQCDKLEWTTNTIPYWKP